MVHLVLRLPPPVDAPNHWSAVWLSTLPRWVQPTKRSNEGEADQTSVYPCDGFFCSSQPDLLNLKKGWMTRLGEDGKVNGMCDKTSEENDSLFE